MHLVGKALFNQPRRKLLCNGKGAFVQLLKRKHSANVPLILPTAHQESLTTQQPRFQLFSSLLSRYASGTFSFLLTLPLLLLLCSLKKRRRPQFYSITIKLNKSTDILPVACFLSLIFFPLFMIPVRWGWTTDVYDIQS